MRMTAQELLTEVRSEYPRYIGDCCRTKPSPKTPPPPPPPPITGYLVTSYKIARRELNKESRYGDYLYSADNSRSGNIKVQQSCSEHAWATTRSIVVEMLDNPRSIEEHCKLPAFRMHGKEYS